MRCNDCEDSFCKEGINCYGKDIRIYAENEIKKEENSNFYITSTELEVDAYMKLPRVLELIEFSKRMNYKKLGIASCIGLKNESQILTDLLQEKGFEVSLAICKAHGIGKGDFGVVKTLSNNLSESACNPIGQAKLLEKEGTEFNIVVGLCVGHDSLFIKYSKAPTTVLIVKDRILAHNPIGALYSNYWIKKIKNYKFE
ncbi:MAG TPA: DUF1847 domain-containing protein [Methanofastidiosum sp.]|nr:DUF1847 domain-containing protein [Methanofastidiosum sp.]HPC81448.1 DUF1847 domain-containing protein [Methanofastidiosum sp.]HRS26509.1 DUF1847 domain-containing protein [Methanofastidiosum sp.]